jgi:hypothetical protein
MNPIKTLTALALGSAFLAGCGAQKDESAEQTDTPSPAVEAPVDEMAPADATDPTDTDALPSDEADPAMSDSLPTAEKPPPTQPPPPPG